MVLELIRKTKVTQNLIEFNLMNPHGLSIKKVSVAPVILEPPALARMCRGAANDEMQQNLPEMYILPWETAHNKKGGRMASHWTGLEIPKPQGSNLLNQDASARARGFERTRHNCGKWNFPTLLF